AGEGSRAATHHGARLAQFGRWWPGVPGVLGVVQERPGVEHTVYVLTSRLWCDCRSSRYRGACAHRAVVRKALEAEALNVRRAEDSAEETAELGWIITAKGRRALAQLDERKVLDLPPVRLSDTAPRRGPKAFSLLK